MISAIIMAVAVSIFYALTKFWGAWYSLTGEPTDRKSTMMPFILSGPRFLVTIGGLMIGMMGLDWDMRSAGWYVGITLAAFVLLTTAEVIYVETKLRTKSYRLGRKT